MPESYRYKPDPNARPDQQDLLYWKHQAAVRQRIINKLEKNVQDLTASVVQLENDYDLVETELKALQEKKERPKQRILIL